MVLQPLGTFITSLHLMSLSGTLLTRAGGLLRYSGSLMRLRRKETTAFRLGEVRMISVNTIVSGEEAVIPGEPAAAANANTLR